MNNMTLKKIMAAAAGAALMMPAAAEMPESVIPQKAANKPPFLLQAQAPKISKDGTASFVLDLSSLSPFGFLRLLNSDRTAIFFRDKPAEPEKLCPYFELAGRKYEVREIDPKKPVYRINAPISADEIEKIEKAGCFITKTISRHEIKPYQP